MISRWKVKSNFWVQRGCLAPHQSFIGSLSDRCTPFKVFKWVRWEHILRAQTPEFTPPRSTEHNAGGGSLLSGASCDFSTQLMVVPVKLYTRTDFFVPTCKLCSTDQRESNWHPYTQQITKQEINWIYFISCFQTKNECFTVLCNLKAHVFNVSKRNCKALLCPVHIRLFHLKIAIFFLLVFITSMICLNYSHTNACLALEWAQTRQNSKMPKLVQTKWIKSLSLL